MLDWPKIAPLPWKARRAAVEAAAREFLACSPHVYTTRQLATMLAGLYGDGKTENAIGAELMKIAPYIGEPLATHDGDNFIAYGKLKKRWRWHGQAPAGEPASASGIAADRRDAPACLTCGARAVINGRCTACGKR